MKNILLHFVNKLTFVLIVFTSCANAQNQETYNLYRDTGNVLIKSIAFPSESFGFKYLNIGDAIKTAPRNFFDFDMAALTGAQAIFSIMYCTPVNLDGDNEWYATPRPFLTCRLQDKGAPQKPGSKAFPEEAYNNQTTAFGRYIGLKVLAMPEFLPARMEDFKNFNTGIPKIIGLTLDNTRSDDQFVANAVDAITTKMGLPPSVENFSKDEDIKAVTAQCAGLENIRKKPANQITIKDKQNMAACDTEQKLAILRGGLVSGGEVHYSWKAKGYFAQIIHKNYTAGLQKTVSTSINMVLDGLTEKTNIWKADLQNGLTKAVEINSKKAKSDF